MGLISFINKKTTFQQQKSYLKTIPIGFLIGFIVVEFIKYLIIKDITINKFIFSFIFTTIFDFIVISPLIYAYIKNYKKYWKLIEKIRIKNYPSALAPMNTGISVRIIYDFNGLLKGEVYEIFINPILYEYKEGKFVVYICPNMNVNIFALDFINKVDIVDIKEERRRKLKKIQRWL